MEWWEAVLGVIAVVVLTRMLIHDHQYVEIAGREYCGWCGKQKRD